MANNLGIVQLHQDLGQMLFYHNPCKLLQRGQFSALYGVTYMAKKYILPSHKGKATPRYFFSPDWSAFGYFNSMCYTNTDSSQSSKNMKYRMEAG